MNWLDIIILLALLFYAFEGFEIGFVASVLDLLSFVGSFILGLQLYSLVASFLLTYLTIPQSFANAIGFFVVAFIAEFTLLFILRSIIGIHYDHFVHSVEENIKTHTIVVSQTMLVSLNRFLGILPGLLSAYILVSFLLTVVLALPFSPFLKQSISQSRFGNTMIAGTQQLEGTLQKIFGQTLSETLNFLTVKPQSTETVSLGFSLAKVSENEKVEEEMLGLVNSEREKAGLRPLVMDEKLRQVARLHSKDMFARGYFSHYTPELVSPFDRMINFGVIFVTAGENLALAPNAMVAMAGFMQSEGHKKNILSPTFEKVGIGAIDGGVYGIMFAQEFTD